MRELDKETKILLYIAVIFAGLFSMVCISGTVGILLFGTLWLLNIHLSITLQIVCATIAIISAAIISISTGKKRLDHFFEKNGFK